LPDKVVGRDGRRRTADAAGADAQTLEDGRGSGRGPEGMPRARGRWPPRGRKSGARGRRGRSPGPRTGRARPPVVLLARNRRVSEPPHGRRSA
jgi:hypothetical protein